PMSLRRFNFYTIFLISVRDDVNLVDGNIAADLHFACLAVADRRVDGLRRAKGAHDALDRKRTHHNSVARESAWGQRRWGGRHDWEFARSGRFGGGCVVAAGCLSH